MKLLQSVVLAVAIIVAGFLIGGRYDTVGLDGSAWVVAERFTGKTWLCHRRAIGDGTMVVRCQARQ